jgi:hypothetical protein
MKYCLLLLSLLIAGCTARSSQDLRGSELYWAYVYEGSNGWEATHVATLHGEEDFVVSFIMFSSGKIGFSGQFDDWWRFGPPSYRKEMIIDSILQGFTSVSCEILAKEDAGEWRHADSVTAIDNIPEFDTLTSKRLGYFQANVNAPRFEDLPPYLRRGGVSHYFHFTPFTGHDIYFQVRYHFRRQNRTTDSVSKQLHYQWRLTQIPPSD